MVIVDTLLLAMGMGMDLAMPGMDMESVMLMLSQRLMLSTILMADMVLDTVFILLVMDMDILDTLLLAMPMLIMDMESVMLTLCQRLMLSMEPMLDMVTDLDIVHTPWIRSWLCPLWIWKA